MKILVDPEDEHFLIEYRYHLRAPQWPGGSWYAQRMFKRADGKWRATHLHVDIMQPVPGLVVDHINGDGLDCRRRNMRVVTRSANSANRTRSANNTSGFRGVTWDKRCRKWRAQYKTRGVNHYLGSFTDATFAAALVSSWRVLYLGGARS